MSTPDLVRLDLSHWPVAVGYIVGIPGETQTRDYLRQLDALLARRQPYAMVTDATLFNHQYAAGFKSAMDRWTQDNKARIAEFVQLSAIVIDSAFKRTALRAYLLFSPQPGGRGRVKVVATVSEGIEAGRLALGLPLAA